MIHIKADGDYIGGFDIASECGSFLSPNRAFW